MRHTSKKTKSTNLHLTKHESSNKRRAVFIKIPDGGTG